MPKYYFHYYDEMLVADEDGESFADDAAACRRADSIAEELTGECGPALILVTDTPDGEPIYRVSIPIMRWLH